jgi:hypothetical protein
MSQSGCYGNPVSTSGANWEILNGDFNGDGLLDISVYQSSSLLNFGLIQVNTTTNPLNGYCWPQSADPGDDITFYYSGEGNPVMKIYQYESRDNTVTQTFKDDIIITPSISSSNLDVVTMGCGWTNTVTYTIPSTWESGFYSACLEDESCNKKYVTFLVKSGPTISNKKVALIANTNTWAAYNDYNVGSSQSGTKYDNNTNQSYSFMRPNNVSNPMAQITNRTRAELWIYTWLKDNGYDPDVIADMDVHLNTNNFLNQYDFLIMGTHPEYWTGAMYDKVQEFQTFGNNGNGGHLICLGGNAVFEACDINLMDPSNPKLIAYPNSPGGATEQLNAQYPLTDMPGVGGVAGPTDVVTTVYDRFDFFLETYNFGSNQTPVYKRSSDLIGTHYNIINNIVKENNVTVNTTTSYNLNLTNPAISFLTNGISNNIIGDFGYNTGQFIVADGSGKASGWECERYTNSTPPNIPGLNTPASPQPVTSIYDGFVEIVATGTTNNFTAPRLNFPNGLNYSEIIYVPQKCTSPKRGFVFTAGSITFGGSLVWNYNPTTQTYDNDVSKLLLNVLNHRTLQLVSANQPNCVNTATGSIVIQMGVTTPGINYSISPSVGNQFSPGHFSSLPAGAYQITATDANGCTLTTTITLTDPPALTWSSVQATNPSCAATSSGSINVTAGGGTGTITYTINSSNGQFTGLVASNYLVTATDANGCSITTSITLYQPNSNHCCSTNSNPNAGSNIALLPNIILLPNTQVSTLNASALLANYGSGGVIQGKKFYVDGTLVIDADITLDACDFWLTPFSQIIVQGGHTFNLVNTNLSASCDWWVGIEVQQIQNKVSSTGGSINRAIVGIHASQDAILELNGTTWNEIGQAGIIFANMNSTSYTGYVKNCQFNSTGLQPNSITTQHGILIRDAAHLNLGNTNAGNHFDGVRCGISINNSTPINSTIGLYDNTFENIHAPLYPTNLSSQQQEVVNHTYLDDQGTAIFANFNINQNAILQTNSLFIDHLGTPTPNMVQCDRGIVTIGGHTSVKNQDMPDVLLGIMCYSPFSRQYDIKNNKIENAHMGIQVAGQPKSDFINANSIDLTQNVVRQIAPVAIIPPVGVHTQQAQTQSLPGNYLHRINNNTINLHTITGVGIRKQYGDVRSEMSMNTTHLLTTSSAPPNSHVIRTLIGYWTERCFESAVIDNVTAGFGNFSIYEQRNAYGVYIDNSPFCKWQCNSANGTRYGFYAWGNNQTQKDAVKFNHQNGNEFPWYFLDGSATQYGTLGNIGDPLSTGNEPANEFVGNLQWIGALNINPSSNYKVFRSSTFPSGHQISTNSSYLIFNESGALTVAAKYAVGLNTNFFTENCQNPNSGTLNLQEEDEAEYVEYIQDVVADSVEYINYDEVGSWINQYRVYTTLDIDSALRYSEIGLLNFYTTRQNLNIGRLRETDRLIEILFDSTTDAGNFNTRYQAALAANNQISSGEEWELNEKRMNEALIYSSATPVDSLEQSLKDDIAILAHACPFVAGQAVYKARRVWSFWQPNALFDDRLLCLQAENKNGENEIEDIDNYYTQQISAAQNIVVIPSNTKVILNASINFKEHTRVYPIPINTMVNIELGRNEPAELTIYNLLGEKVLSVILKLQLTKLSLDQLVPGFYQYRIKYTNGDCETGKLTKQ